jgi:hypothetical protein
LASTRVSVSIRYAPFSAMAATGGRDGRAL